jgi:addiction module antitoxin, RelB/DinJ family
MNVTIRMDEELKKQFETVVNDVGLNMTSAVTAFAKAVVREGGMPFELKRGKSSFYSPANMAALKESIEQHQRGELITFGSVEEAQKAAMAQAEDAD